MQSSIELKTWLHKPISRIEKLLMVLASRGKPSSLADLRLSSEHAGFKIPKKWNLSSILGRSKGMAINTPAGWEITIVGTQHLIGMGVFTVSPAIENVTNNLRSYLEEMQDTEAKEFILEAIKCYEHGLYRSAVVMSWLGAISILHRHVAFNRLNEFNKEAARVDPKWKNATTTDDLGKMNEDKFLDTIERLSIIGKNVKDILKECLKRRNGCGHPNSMKVGINQTTAHIEILLMHVFRRFS